MIQTVLETFAEQPDAHVWFGPDTYMGHNLRVLFESLAGLDDAAIAAVHPRHDRASIAALLPRFHYFEQGNCIVHHMFGGEVVERVRRDYPTAHITAHLEVPGEMFALALEAQRHGRGVVGSTSDILGHITREVQAAGQRGGPAHLQFVLGTEAGMITSIVHAVRGQLRAHPQVTVEIVFPVAVIVIGGMITSTVLTLVVVPVAYLLFDRLVTGRSMRWISHKFFGVDPDAPPESLDDPLPVHATPSGHVPSTSQPHASDEFPIDTDLVIPTIVKPVKPGAR